MWFFRRPKPRPGPPYQTISMDAPTRRAVERAGRQPACDCFEPCYTDKPWRELSLHDDIQDTACDGWKRLLDIVERAAEEEWELFEPGALIPWDAWIKVVTLPASIGRMTHVREVRLYGGNLMRIPPEIGEMARLEILDLYTSYRLHWLPYEATRCKALRESRFSTRALYGNFKHRPPFPRLPALVDQLRPAACSICRGPFGESGARQRWVSLRVATDVLPLLVHACSEACLARLPTPAKGYVQRPHRGSLGLAQPARR